MLQKGLLGRRLIVRRLMQPRRDYLLVRGLRKYCLSDIAGNKCFHTICVHNINWQNMHTSKDEKHLTRHWREITLTSTLLWQSIEFITSYNPEYCWPGLCLTHSKKCTINITITHKALISKPRRPLELIESI